MNKYILLVILGAFLSLNVFADLEKKLIGLVPVKNEQDQIKQCLYALSHFVDEIVVLDDASTDRTVEVIEEIKDEVKVGKIIKKTEWFRDEPGDKNKLLQAGRELGGTHFILLDADEALTSNLLDSDFLRKAIFNLKKGDRMYLTWIQFWRSPKMYRFDDSIWTNQIGDFIFCDDGVASYSSEFIHTSRSPNNLKGKVYKLSGYNFGVMHFQFVNWDNLLLKQEWYRCLEKIRIPEKKVSEINQRYQHACSENNLNRKQAPSDWFNRYKHFDHEVYTKPNMWRVEMMKDWYSKYGKDYFKGLDVRHSLYE